MSKSRPIHPSTKLVPPLTPVEFRELCDDIEENGLNDPITLDQNGQIIDGVHRERACIERSVPPRYETKVFEEDDDVVDFVWSRLVRRNLNPGQRLMIRLSIDGELDRIRLSRGVDVDTSAEPGKTREILGRRANTNASTAGQAMVVFEDDQALCAKVLTGAVTLNQAYKQAMRKRRQEGRAGKEAVEAAEAAEHRTTPPWVSWTLMTHPHARDSIRPGARVIDMFAGEGQIPHALNQVVSDLRWTLCEIRPSCADALRAAVPDADVHIGDFFELDSIRAALAACDVAVFNPAFSLAFDAVRYIFEHGADIAVWMLVRRNWLDQARAEWLRGHMPDERNLPKRIHFGQAATGEEYDGTDNCLHMWAHWPRSGRDRTESRGSILTQVGSAEELRTLTAGRPALLSVA